MTERTDEIPYTHARRVDRAYATCPRDDRLTTDADTLQACASRAASVKPQSRTRHDACVELPSCPDCGQPVTLLDDTRYVYCLTLDCVGAVGIPISDVVLDEDCQPRPGMPRPILEGRPVPWLAIVVGSRVAWTALNEARGREARRSWLCQVCGESLAEIAWIAVSAGVPAQGGALHLECLDLARKVCPALRKDESFVFAEVRREDEHHEWASAVERLAAYEHQHGQLPEMVPIG
jgi:hypothetical protein